MRSMLYDRSVLGTLVETLGACVVLAGLGLRRLRAPRASYWRWRHETAFGTDPSAMPTAAERRRAIWSFARWAARMRMLR